MTIKILQKFFKGEKEILHRCYGSLEPMMVYEFALPTDNSYAIAINKNWISLDSNGIYGKYYVLNIPYSDYQIKACKVENREEGKRYKQFTYCLDEIQALYENELDSKSNNLILCLAKIKNYANSNDRFAKEVRSTKLYLGQRDARWFYSSDQNTKRKLNTKGVEILLDLNNEYYDECLHIFKSYIEQNEALIKAITTSNHINLYCKSMNLDLERIVDADENNIIAEDINSIKISMESMIVKIKKYADNIDVFTDEELIKQLKTFSI